MYKTYIEDRERFLSEIQSKMDEQLYDDVVILAEERFTRFPGDMDAYLAVASCGAEMNRPTEAAEIVEQWHDIVRDQSRVYEVLGDAYGRKGMIQEAIESYRKFADLNPGAAARISEKIASLHDGTIEENDDMEDTTELSAVPSDFSTITLARLYVKQGHFKMAGDVLGTILAKDPGNVEARKYAEHVLRLMEKGWKPVIDELDRWLNVLREKNER